MNYYSPKIQRSDRWQLTLFPRFLLKWNAKYARVLLNTRAPKQTKLRGKWVKMKKIAQIRLEEIGWQLPIK